MSPYKGFYKLVCFVLAIALFVTTACDSPETTALPPAPAAPSFDPNAQVQVAPFGGTVDVSTPVAIPAPHAPDDAIQVIEIPVSAEDPFWDNLEASMQQYAEYTNKGDSEVQLAGVGDAVLLVLLNELNRSGCITGNWIFDHLTADGGWRIGRLGGFAALDLLIRNLKGDQFQLIGVAIQNGYTRVGFWFRTAGQDIMLILNSRGGSTMIPLQKNDANYTATAVENGVRLFRNIVQYNPANGEVNGHLMINKDPAIWGSMVGEFTIGIFALTTSVIVARQFLVGFGGCIEKAFLEYQPYKDWKASNNQGPAKIHITISEQEAEDLAKGSALVFGVVLVVKIAISVFTGQWEVMLIPAW